MLISVVEYTLAIKYGERIGYHEDRIRRIAIHRGESVCEVVRFAHAQGLNDYAEGFGSVCRCLIPKRHAEVSFVPQHCNLTDAWCSLLEQSKTLGTQRHRIVRNTGHISSRPRKTINEAGCNRVASAKRDHGRNAVALHRGCWRITEGNHRVDLICRNVARHLRQLVKLHVGTVGRVFQVLSKLVATLCQCRQKHRDVGVVCEKRAARVKRRKMKGLCSCLRSNGPGHRYHSADKQLNEIAASHELPSRQDHIVSQPKLSCCITIKSTHQCRIRVIRHRDIQSQRRQCPLCLQ